MQLFTIFFSRPIEFGLATALTVLMLVILRVPRSRRRARAV